MNPTTVIIKDEADISAVRMEARQIAKRLGFNTVDQARISLATSELARLAHATINKTGEIEISQAEQDGQAGMQVVCVVNTIPQIEGNNTTMLAEQLKFRRGLASVSRLVDESLLKLDEDGQASVTLIKWFH